MILQNTISEVNIAQRITFALESDGIFDSSTDHYVDCLSAALDTFMQRSSNSPVALAALTANMIAARSKLAAEAQTIVQWLSIASAIAPDKSSYRIPDRFVVQDQPEPEQSVPWDESHDHIWRTIQQAVIDSDADTSTS